MNSLPTLLIPGLACGARLYAHQIPALWRFGPVMVADHTRQSSMAELARDILADAPPRFALMGLSMGGYIALEIMRQAPGRVVKLALLDTSARPDTPEQSEARRARIAMAQRRFCCDPGADVSRSGACPSQGGRRPEGHCRGDGRGNGRGRFHPAADRHHGQAGFAAWAYRDTVPHAGAGGRWRRTDAAGACAGDRARYSRRAAGNRAGLRAPFDAGAPRGRHAKARRVASARLMLVLHRGAPCSGLSAERFPQRHSRECGNPCQQKMPAVQVFTMGSRLRGNDATASWPTKFLPRARRNCRI